MTSKTRKPQTRHPLLVYQQISRRLRSLPLMLVFVGALLLVLSILGKIITLQGVDTSMLDLLASGQPLIVVIITASALLYIFAVFMGRNSYIETRPKMLHIQTGLLAVNISYRRIRQIRLSQVSVLYPEKTARGNDRQIIEELGGLPCSLVDLASWPSFPGHKGLKLLWSKLMFTSDGDSLMIVVRDAMVFNQQLDGRMSGLQQAKKQEQSRYLDPLQRATQAQKGKR